MCGIVGYTGNRDAYPILMEGLRRLDYRGYESAGIGVVDASQRRLVVKKCLGTVDDLDRWILSNGGPILGKNGISHTRWPTHGKVIVEDAHPHRTKMGDTAMVHNGVIHNYLTLRALLEEAKYTFDGGTDTEVLIKLVGFIQETRKVELIEAVRLALNQVKGSYAIIIASEQNPNQLIVAKNGSPLLIGIGEGEHFAASDGVAVVKHTKRVVYLDDGEMAVITPDNFRAMTIQNVRVSPIVQALELDDQDIELSPEFSHYMQQEIHCQPQSLRRAVRGRLMSKEGIVKLGGIAAYEKHFLSARRLILPACGTSYNACLVGELLFEELAHIPVDVEYASEFHIRNPLMFPDDLMMVVTQSGETADTLLALKEGKRRGIPTLALCNVVGSSIAREADGGVYLNVGTEVGVASTKAFTGQVAMLTLMALRIGQLKGTISPTRFRQLLDEFETIPERIEQVLKLDEQIRSIAERYFHIYGTTVLGKQYLYPVALEGELKIKEVSYIHAEAQPAAEMKHGHIALVEEDYLVIVLALKNGSYDKVLTNLEEVKTRGAKIIAIITEGDNEIKSRADHVIEVPRVDHVFGPLVAVVPLQLLAYHFAILRKCNVDKPRNLAKSVTVE